MTRLLYNASKFILVVMSLTHISFFLFNATKLSIYLRNIQIDFGEGILLGNAKRLTNSLTIYPDIKVETVFGVYPPLYQLLSAGMINITGLNLASGRIISTIASIITAILIYKSASTQDKLLKITFPALYLSSPIIMTWGPLMRVDALATMFTILGIYLFMNAPEKLRIPLAATALATSTLTKQNMLAGTIAILIFLLTKKWWKNALKFLAYYSVIFGGTTALITIVTNGQYINHIYLYHLGHEYKLSKLFTYNQFFSMHLIVITTAILFTIYYLKAGKITPLLYYYPLALLFSLSILKIGAATNYYVEPVTSMVLFLAVSSRKISKKRDILMIAFTLLMVSQFVIYCQNITLVPNIEENLVFSNKQKLLGYLQSIDGRVLCEDATAAVISRKGPAVDWFILAQIFRKHLWNEHEYVEKLIRENFTYLILSFDITPRNASNVENERFTHKLLKEFQENFILKEKIGNYRVYVYKEMKDYG